MLLTYWFHLGLSMPLLPLMAQWNSGIGHYSCFLVVFQIVYARSFVFVLELWFLLSNRQFTLNICQQTYFSFSFGRSKTQDHLSTGRIFSNLFTSGTCLPSPAAWPAETSLLGLASIFRPALPPELEKKDFFLIPLLQNKQKFCLQQQHCFFHSKE